MKFLCMIIILTIGVFIISSSCLIAQADMSSLIIRSHNSTFQSGNEPGSLSSLRKDTQANNKYVNSLLRRISENYFSHICHQDHSILINTEEGIIPLCPRCIGLHIGFIISYIVLRIAIGSQIKISRKLLSVFLFIGLGMMSLEWILAHYSILQSSLLSRLLTGLIAGSNFGLLLVLYRNENTFSFKIPSVASRGVQVFILYLIISSLGLSP